MGAAARMVSSQVLGFRQAARRLLSSPGYTITALSVLALCIAAVTAIFSVVYGVLLEPYGFQGQGKLIVWHETAREYSAQFPILPVNYRHFQYIAAHADDLASAALVQPNTWTVSVGSGHPVQVSGMTVTSKFFTVLGAEPSEGRAFLPQENQRGRDNEVILSAAAAQRFFGTDRHVEGRTQPQKRRRLGTSIPGGGYHAKYGRVAWRQHPSHQA